MSVYSKLDWYTVLIYKSSLRSVLSKLCFSDVFDDFLSSGFERSEGYTSKFIFSVNGVSVEVSADDYFSVPDHETLFLTDVAKIRLDISGSGLDYLASRGFDLSLFSAADFWGVRGVDYKITRADFAFDFVNYPVSILNPLLNYIRQCEIDGIITSSSSRLLTGVRGGIKYKYRSGDMSCLWLGANRSDRMCRIYDKLLQFKKDDIWIKNPPAAFFDDNDDITSWERVEFQCRRETAETYLLDNRVEAILGVFFSDYLIRDFKTGKPLDFLVSFYDWSKIPRIIQNKNYIEQVFYIEKAKNFIKRQAFKSIFTYISAFGVDDFVNLINSRASELYSNDLVSSVYGRIALGACLSRVCDEAGKSREEALPFLSDAKNGGYKIKI